MDNDTRKNERADTDAAKHDGWGQQGQELRFTTSEGIHRTTVGEVVQLTSHGSYTNVQLICGGSIHVSKNLGQHEEKLTPFSFYRVHEKHLVNMAHITRFERAKSGPNVHLCTINDFDQFCADHKIHVKERLVLTNGERVHFMPNLLGSLAMYRLEKNLETI